MSDTEERKIRSVRLTKAHRADIINAVMVQWRKKNPVPAICPMETLVKAALSQNRKFKKSWPVEKQAFGKALLAAEKVIALRAELSPAESKLVSLAACQYMSLILTDSNGDKEKELHFSIPNALMGDLGLPSNGTRNIRYRYDQGASSWLLAYSSKGNIEDGYFDVDVGSIPYNHHQLTLYLDAGSSAYKNYLSAIKQFNAQADAEKAQREEVADYLNQFNTTGQLRESWPEVVPYLPAHIADPERVIQLPALINSRLNERLGLKPKK